MYILHILVFRHLKSLCCHSISRSPCWLCQPPLYNLSQGTLLPCGSPCNFASQLQGTSDKLSKLIRVVIQLSPVPIPSLAVTLDTYCGISRYSTREHIMSQTKGDAEMMKVCPLSGNQHTGGPLEGPQVPLSTIIPFSLHVLAHETHLPTHGRLCSVSHQRRTNPRDLSLQRLNFLQC